jgi:hypothetical protein
MPRRPAAAAAISAETLDSATSGSAVETTRTTLVLPVALDQNLELYAVQEGLPKSEVIKRVLADYLAKKGFQPDRRPKSITVSY